MNNNVTTNQENKTSETTSNNLVWQAPVLYKEDWMNTLTGTSPVAEGTTITAGPTATADGSH